ncbi:MAG: DEAD/DEAH box helicase [Elusimicrobia bacterium]|nr:DEAD/DEAH box helicase [Elusimicrobiota bacterium]
MVNLRGYQAGPLGVEGIRTAFNDGAQSVLYVSPTGSGKTVVFSYIAHNAAERRTRTCIVVHRDTLLRQASQALTFAGVPHGIIAPGHSPTADLVHVASVQTLVRRLTRHEFDFLIIDEAHHAVAGSWRKVLESYREARVLGVTATPRRHDGRGLGDVFQKMVVGPSTVELIELGYLVPPVVYAPSSRPDLSRLKVRGSDYDKRELTQVMDKPVVTGDAVAHYRKICPGVPFVVFCVSIQHAEDVAADFNAAGISTAAISGRMRPDEVERALEGLADGRLLGVSSCDLISEGFDCPRVTAAISLRPTQSEALYIQQVGRALRPAPGKDRAIILDHAGNLWRHGWPDDPRNWELTTGRGREKGDAGAGISVRQCPSCYACHKPALSCPECGHVYVTNGREVEQVAGELAQADPGKDRLERWQRFKKIREAASLAEMQQIGLELGYKPGWAWIQWQLRQTRTQQIGRNA